MRHTKSKYNRHFFILTGGPGVGKTSVIRALSDLHFHCVDEAARQIIQHQVRTKQNAVPWYDKERYKTLMLERSIADYRQTEQMAQKITFFDRGIPDTFAYARLEKLSITKKLRFYSQYYRYNKTVFIFPPWEQIYQTDAERKQSFGEVKRTHQIMIKTYEHLGYSLIEVPQKSVDARVEFILSRIHF